MSSDSSSYIFAPSTEASWRSAASARSCSSFSALPGVRTHSRSRSAPRRCADRLRHAARHALFARRQHLGGEALRADLLGDLAQRYLPQGGEVLEAEEVVECGVDALARVDLAGAQPLEQGLGREVNEHDLVG